MAVWNLKMVEQLLVVVLAVEFVAVVHASDLEIFLSQQ